MYPFVQKEKKNPSTQTMYVTTFPIFIIKVTINPTLICLCLKLTTILFLSVHKPASKGTPLPGIQEPPAKKSPTENLTASEGLVIT